MSNEWTNEKLALAIMAEYFKSTGFNEQFIQGKDGSSLLLSQGLMDIGIVFTLCNVDGREFVKLEELGIVKRLRGRAIGSSLLSIICATCESAGVNLGLWTRGEPKLDKWYKHFGFDLIEISEDSGDFWYEKTRTMDLDYLTKKLGNENVDALTRLKEHIPKKMSIIKLRDKYKK